MMSLSSEFLFFHLLSKHTVLIFIICVLQPVDHVLHWHTHILLTPGLIFCWQPCSAGV
jgi:hypothetical protein